jgi:peptidoglycan/LPS O-acetylase OafA/YrhL
LPIRPLFSPPTEPTNAPLPVLVSLDWLRGLAITMVFGYAVLDYVYDLDLSLWNGLWRNFSVPLTVKLLYPLSMGCLGVAILFVVSGFCIHLSWTQQHKQSWGRFFNQRFFRLLPPYWVMLTLYTFCPPFRDPIINGVEWLSHLALLHNIRSDWAWGINSTFWTLAVQWQLYLLYPALLWLKGRLGWRNTLGVLGLTEFGLRLWLGLGEVGWVRPLFFPLVLNPLSFWFSWSIGAWLADMFLHRRPITWPKRLTWTTGLLSMGLLSCRLTQSLAFLTTALTVTGWLSLQLRQALPQTVALPSAPKRLLLAGLTGTPGTGPALPWFERLSHVGIMGYSIYLIYQPLLMNVLPVFTNMMPGGMDNWANSLPGKFCCAMAMAPITLWLAGFVHRWLERPSLKLGEWVYKQSHPPEDDAIQWISVIGQDQGNPPPKPPRVGKF